jgi:hypothetical protein
MAANVLWRRNRRRDEPDCDWVDIDLIHMRDQAAIDGPLYTIMTRIAYSTALVSERQYSAAAKANGPEISGPFT